MIKISRKRAVLMVTVALAMVLVTAINSTAFAATPAETDGLIHGCYLNSASLTDAKGLLRLIDKDASQSCVSGETALSWDPQSATRGVTRRDLSNTDVTSVTFVGRDLRGVKFTGADLSNSTLTNNNFDGDDFSGATLMNTHVHASSFKGANFTGATIYLAGAPSLLDMGSSYFNHTNENMDFRNANFTNANLIGSPSSTSGYWQADYKGANFTGTTISRTIEMSDMTGVDFRNTRFAPEGGIWTKAGFGSTNLSFANFSGMKLDHFIAGDVATKLEHADFSNTTITNSSFNSAGYGAVGANFTNSTIKDVDWQSADLNFADFTDAHLENIDFTYTRAANMITDGVTWVNVICPDQTNSNDNGNTCVGHLE